MARKKKQPEATQATESQIQQATIEDKAKRETSCIEQITEVLKQTNCKLDVSMLLSEGKVTPKISITAV